MHNSIALLLIDFQKAFDNQEYFGGNRNNPNAEQNAKLLLDYFRKNSLPVIHTRHNSLFNQSPLRKGQGGNEFIDILTPLPDELIIEKNVNSAFIGTNLQDVLDRTGIKKLIIGGLITNHCVSTTARMAGNYGYEVLVVSDATATFDRKGIDGQLFDSELVHQVSLASLNEEFAEILSTAETIEILEEAKRKL
jgi:nicotinamidase-related amidase